MRSPYLSPTSPEELSVGAAGSPGYFDVSKFLAPSRATPVLPEMLPKWDAPWVQGGGLFGPRSRVNDHAEAIDLQNPGTASEAVWKDIVRTGSSPRHRPAFARDATSTPAFFVPYSPIPRDSVFLSPSLPFVSPTAPPASKRRRAQKKKIIPARRLAGSRAFWLSLYFAFNLSLTLYNKGVLVRFPFPYTLTAVHALFGSLGGCILRRRKVYTPAHLTIKNYAILAAFSILYAVNIAVSNISLQLVTIPVSSSYSN